MTGTERELLLVTSLAVEAMMTAVASLLKHATPDSQIGPDVANQLQQMRADLRQARELCMMRSPARP